VIILESPLVLSVDISDKIAKIIRCFEEIAGILANPDCAGHSSLCSCNNAIICALVSSDHFMALSFTNEMTSRSVHVIFYLSVCLFVFSVPLFPFWAPKPVL